MRRSALRGVSGRRNVVTVLATGTEKRPARGAVWTESLKNEEWVEVSLNLNRNRVERFVVDPVVLIPAGFNRDRNDIVFSLSGCSITENRHELDLQPDHLS